MRVATISKATISKSCAGKCFISILVEFNEESLANQESLESTTAGLDVGIKEVVILSI